MKRFVLFLCISIMAFAVLGGFVHPKSAIAQSSTASQTNVPGGITQEQVVGFVNSYFSSSLVGIDASIEKNKTSLGENSQAYKDYVATVPKIKEVVANSQSLYNKEINNPEYSGYNLKDVNDLATSAAVDLIISEQNKTASLRTPAAKQALNSIANNLRNLPTQQLWNFSNTALNTAGPRGGTAVANERLTSAVARTNSNIESGTSLSSPSSCNLFSGNLVSCIDSLIAWIIKHTLLEIAGFLVWVSASMLNLSIQYGILDFARWAPDTLYPIWYIVRQIVSLFIVFAGLYLGAMYILGRDDKFQRYIPWVIIFALFVNFSYPLTRALIDVSNVISLNIYASTMGTSALTGSISDLTSKTSQTPGTIIREKLGLQSLIFSTVNKEGASMAGSIDSTPGALMAVAFTLYAAFIFFMVTSLMLLRTAILVFLTIASPILFIDSVIPQLGEEAVKLRKMYFEQLAVAPVFMIMLALTLKFLEVFQPTGALKSSGATVAVFFNILIMLIMLHIMYKVTKHVAGSIGEMATKAMGTVGGFGLGLASGGAGLLARGTLGKAAMSMRDSKWVTNNQDSFLGRRAYGMTNALASSTYDARNSGMIAGGMAKAGMGMGAGGKMNYGEALQARNKDRVDRYSRIKQTYEDDVRDNKGNILHRKGDVIEEGKAAAYKFSKTGGVLTNRKDLIKDLKGVQEKQNTSEVTGVDKLKNEFIKNYNGVLKKNKGPALNNLKKQLEDIQKTDPNLEGERARALSQAVREIEVSKNKEKEDFRKLAINSFRVYGTMTEDKKKTYLAQQTDELQAVIKKMIVAEGSSDRDGNQNKDIVGEIAEEESSRLFGIEKKAEVPTPVPETIEQADPTNAPINYSSYDTPTYFRKNIPIEGVNTPINQNNTTAEEAVPYPKPRFLMDSIEKMRDDERIKNQQAGVVGNTPPLPQVEPQGQTASTQPLDIHDQDILSFAQKRKAAVNAVAEKIRTGTDREVKTTTTTTAPQQNTPAPAPLESAETMAQAAIEKAKGGNPPADTSVNMNNTPTPNNLGGEASPQQSKEPETT